MAANLSQGDVEPFLKYFTPTAKIGAVVALIEDATRIANRELVYGCKRNPGFPATANFVRNR